MTQMDGQTPEEYCKGAIQLDIEMSLDDSAEYFGQLLCKGWEETLENDPYYRRIAGLDRRE
jgi:hypothetical protein